MNSIGLDLSADAVRVVVLHKFFNRLRLVKFGEERFVSPQPASEEIIAAMRRLFSRLQIKAKDVVIHLGGAGVRHTILNSPLLATVELSEWVRQQCLERLSANLKLAQLLNFVI